VNAGSLRRDVRDLPGYAGMTGRVVDEIVDAIAHVKGPAAAARVRDEGVQRLHEVIDAREVTPLRDRVLDALRTPLLEMSVAVGRRVLGWTGDFYVDDYLILRVNFPFEVARGTDRGAENPGVGRLSASVRDLFKARKTIDPVYDPKSYHHNLPPAAWAHGPHCDSWAGHSRDGRNIWWAIGPVPADAGMVLYPELSNMDLPPDPRTLYLKAGIPLPPPTALPLDAGEMLVFDPEVLHGTHLNTTGDTRVAVSMRLNASRPVFDPGCFYAREFWRRAADIEAGVDEVLHLPRDENLGPAAPVRAAAVAARLPVAAGAVDPAGGVIRARLNGTSAAALRVIVEADGRRVMVVRTASGLRAYDAACPHYGLDLADGGMDATKLYCPGCALAFDLATGRSACASLALAAYDVREQDGVVLIGAADPADH
jgi:nitrite reductase/ring-hydroxylating ferredoxin subunit